MKKNLPVFFVIALHVALLTSLQFTAWPEMFSFPYLVNNGFSPFRDFVHPYPPLLTLALSVLYKTFGYTTNVLQVFTFGMIGISDLLVYKLSHNFTKNEKISLTVLAIYVFVQSFLDGNMLWFDSALTVPLLLAILMYMRKKWLLMGIALTVACLIKQTAVLYLLIATIAVIGTTKNTRDVFILLVPSIVVFGIGAALLQGQGMWFVNWTVLFPMRYWSSFPGYVRFDLTKFELITTLLIALPFVGALLKKKYLLAALGFAALVAVYPRFSFFHMQPALTVSALSLAILLTKAKKIVVVCLVIAVAFIVIKVPKTWGGAVRFFGSNDRALVETIRKYVPEGSTLYLLNLPSHYYVLTKTIPPFPWLDNYGWYYEVPGQQGEVISAFTSHPPQYILRKEVQAGNWYDLGTYEPSELVGWIATHYEQKEQLTENVWLWIIKS